MMAHADHNTNNGFNDNQPEQKAAVRVENNLMFANDSQEEDYMLQQALQESIAEDETSQTHDNNVGETSTVAYQEHKPSTSNLAALPSTSTKTTNNTSGYNTASNAVQVKDTQHTYHKNNGETSTMTYQEYKPSTSNPGALPSASATTTNDTTGYNTASNDVQVKEETMTEEEEDLQSILQFKLYDEIQSSLQEESSSTHIQQEELNESPDEDLKKVLEQSLQDEQGSTQQEKTNESPDEDLKKVLEQSRLQYEQEQKKTQNRKGQGNSIKKGDRNIHFRRNSRDADLQKALQESRKQYRQEQKSSQAREILQKKEEAKTSNNNEHLANFDNRALPMVLQQSTPMRGSSQPNNREKCNDICEPKAYSEEEILEKALQESRELFAEQQRRAKRDTNLECSKNGATQKSSQASSQKYERHQKSAHCNAGYAQVQKGNVMTEMNKGSRDGDLEKALQESRKQYERQQRIAKMEKRVDAPQVKKEKHDDNKQQSRITFDDEQEQSFPNSEVNCVKKEKTVLQTQDNVPVRYASKDSSTGITKSPSKKSTQIANTSSPNKNIQKGSNYNKDHKPSKRSVTHASKNPSTDITQSPSEKSTQRASTYSPKKNAQEGPNKHQQHKFANSPDNELEKVLQQSRLEYEMEKTKEKLASEDYDEEEALQQALELSRIEMENEKMKEKEKDGTDLSSVACSAHQKINEADKEQYVNNAVKEIESEKMDEKKEHEMDKEEDLQNAVTEMESKQMDKREKSGTCFSPANDSFCQREKQKDVRRKSNNPAKETDNEQFEAKEHNIGINTTPTNNAFSISNVLSDSDKNKDKKNFEDSEGLFHELEIPDFVNENSNNRNQSLSNICTTSTPKSSNSINQSVPVLSRCKESFRDNAARSNPSISNSVTEVSRSSTDDVENEPSHSNSVTMVTEVSWSSTDDVENEPSLSNSVTEVSRRSTDDENEVVGRQEKDESGIDTRNQTPDEHKVDVSSASIGVDVILIDIQDDNDNDYHDDDNEVAVCAKDSSKSYTRSNSLDNINNNSSNNINDNSTNIDPSNQNDDDDGYSVIDTYHDDGATLIDSQGDDYHNSSSNYNNNSASIDPSIRQVQNDYDDDVDNPVIDSYHHDDATLIDSQDNDDHDIYNNNGASIDPSSDQVQNDDDDNNVIDSYHHDDAILIDSQDDNFDNSMQHGEEHNSDTEDTCNNQVNITPHNIYSSKSSDSQNDSSANDHHTRHRDPKTTKTSATFDPGLSFRQKAEAIARGKISLMSLTMSKDNGNHSPRHRPDKRGFDGAVKGNIAPSSSPSPSTSFKSHNSRPSNSTDCIGGKRAIQSSGSSMFPSSYSSTSTEDPSSSTTPTNLMRDSRNNSWSLPPSTTASNPSSSKTPANLSRVSRNVSSRFPHSTSSTTDDNKHFGRKRARKSCNSTSTSNPSSSSTTDSANLMIDSGDTIPYSSTTADDEYSSCKIARKSCHSTSTSTQNPSSSSSRNILSSFSLSPSSASSRNEYLGSKRARKSCDTALVFPSSSPSPSQSSHTSIRHDDAILIDSQDDYEEVDSATDLEIARQLQEEWNNEHKDYGSRSNNVTSTSTTGKTWDSDNNKSGSAASNGSLVFPRSSQSSSVNNYTGDSRNTNTPGAFIFPGSSSCPGSSRSRDDDVHGFVFPGSSSSASPRSGPSSDGQGQSSSHSKGTNAPKCSDCGEIGHRKGTKKCPYYYTEEAQRKREEQARKRKEKRDEEDRQQQEKVDALVAQHTQMAEEAEQIRVQIEQFNRRNNNLPRMVEDVSKLLKKRRKK